MPGTPSAGLDPDLNTTVRMPSRFSAISIPAAGDLVATSDARGCGQNFFYDGAGRILGEDYVPCEAQRSCGVLSAYWRTDVEDLEVVYLLRRRAERAGERGSTRLMPKRGRALHHGASNRSPRSGTRASRRTTVVAER